MGGIIEEGSREHIKLKELFDEHHLYVLRCCMRFAAGDRDWAMDRAQEVFVKLARQMTRKDLGEDWLSNPKAWLYKVAMNTCYEQIRKQRRLRDRVNAFQWVARQSTPSAQAHVQAKRDVSRLEASIAKLPAKERMLISLMYLDEKQQAEVAAIMGISKGYASKLHARAMERLRRDNWELFDG